MAGERRLYLERNCRLPESPAHSRRRNREGPASSKGLNSQRGFGPAVEPRRKSRPRSTSLHGSSPCKCQRLSTLRWDRLPPSRPSTKSGARAGGRRLSDRRLHRWLAGTSASAPSSHGAADLLGLNRAHICVRTDNTDWIAESPNLEDQFTELQGQYLAFIVAYTKLNRRAPAEADFQRHFEVTPPSVHNMIVALERHGWIRRTAGQPRSIEVLMPHSEIPPLD